MNVWDICVCIYLKIRVIKNNNNNIQNSKQIKQQQQKIIKLNYNSIS